MNLTKRQTQIIEQLAAGLTAEEIAAAFCRSVHTVRTQIKQAAERVGARNIANLVAISIRNGWINFVFVALIGSLVMPQDDGLRRGSVRRPVRRIESTAIVI